MISSYHPEYLWNQRYNEGLRKGLQGGVQDLSISHFYMDTKRHPRETFDDIAQGAIGGLVLDDHDQGLQAASLINTILAGTLPRERPCAANISSARASWPAGSSPSPINGTTRSYGVSNNK